MRVITLDTVALEQHVHRLAQAVAAGGRYDIVVGIACGGAVVGEMLCRAMDIAPSRYFTIKSQRPSTKSKSRWLSRLPYILTNPMRILESLWLRRRRSLSDPPVVVSTDLPSDVQSVLVVDDAVDSGATLARVLEALGRRLPGARIDTAVITVTTPNPIVTPTYILYADGTLIRFPWSNDYHGCK